jgi:Flp pilus assembly protein TadG
MGMRRLNKLLGKDERGANLLEMALVSMVLFLLLAGVVDMGRAYNHYIVITNASREGARYASRFPHLESEIKATAVQEAAGGGVALSSGNVSVLGLNAPPGAPIEVRIEYQFDTYLGGLFGLGSFPLRSRTAMVVYGLDT